MKQKLIINNEQEMMLLGADLSKTCGRQCVIYLQGELGAGKTTLVRGFLRALGYKGIVKSPTFTIVEPYKLAEKQIYHFDLYRVSDPEELENIGIWDYFAQHAIILIEWPKRAKKHLPPATITCNIEILNGKREVSIDR